jgi:adenylate cyclase
VAELYDARRLLQQSLSIDPDFARAHAAQAYTYSWSYSNPLDKDYLNPVIVDHAYHFARNAVQLDPNLPQAHSSCGNVLFWRGKPDEAIAEFERAIVLNPNFSDWRFAVALIHAGQAARAIEVIEAHTRLDPFYPPMVLAWSGFAYYVLGKYSEALSPLRACVSRAPNYRAGRLRLAATYAQLGRLNEARAEAAEVLRLEPKYTIDSTQRPLSVFKRTEDVEHFFDGLRKAGLPEK